MKKQKGAPVPERLKKNISGWSEDLFRRPDPLSPAFTGWDPERLTRRCGRPERRGDLTDTIATDEEAKDGVLDGAG